MCTEGIIEHKFKNSKESGWLLKNTDFIMEQAPSTITQKTLVNKVENDLKNYITSSLKVGDKLPAHSELSKLLKVSIKTIHDALKVLIDEGILLPRRGRYGTTVIKLPNDKNILIKKKLQFLLLHRKQLFIIMKNPKPY